MKKILLLASAFVLGMSLAACGGGTDEPDPLVCDTGYHVEGDECVVDTVDCDPGFHEEAGECVADPVDLDYDPDAVYTTYTSGVTNINPYSQMMSSSSEAFGYITDSLYEGDYDWAQAIADGLATEIGDFATSGAAALPFGRFPAMAAAEPVDVNGDGTVWEIELRTDLVFEDGTAIDAHTFEWSWSQLLDPDQLNIRGSVLYDPTSLPVLNAEGYYKQKTPDQDELGFEKYTVGTVEYSRENSEDGAVIGEPTWTLYRVDMSSPWNHTKLVGPNGEEAKVENWGYTASELAGWGYPTSNDTTYFLEDPDGSSFMVDVDGVLYAPTAGWLLDGVAVPVATGDEKYFAGDLPAYADADGNLATVDAEGIPVNGVHTYLDATAVTWAEVGIKAKSDYVLEITLDKAKTAWDVKGNLMSGITGVVHQGKYELGMNDAGTSTTYGTVENPLVSYGAYKLTTWEAETLFIFDINEDHYAHEDYRIKHVRYEFIEDQSVAVEQFKLGNLDLVGAGGDYYDEFKYSPNLKLTPASTFFRFAFNISDRPDADDESPILKYADFRKAFYYAIDRDEFATEVRAPAHPTYGFLGPVYLATEFNSISYRGSDAGTAALADYFPETYGFNPVKARELFDLAYAAAVEAQDITDGELVSVEYKFYDVETNWKVANWTKSTVENIFNDATAAPRFRLDLVAVSGDALDAAWDNKDFDMTFGGWSGVDFNAASMLGQVYNSADLDTMLESGFDTENAEVTVTLAATKAALDSWILGFVEADATDAQKLAYDAWVEVQAKFDGNDLTCTFNELFEYAYDEFYNVADVNYDGKTDDFNAITATLETVLLDQMIAIPLFTRVAATVYSARVVFDANEYHAWMGWGGLKYMYIAEQ